jgi:hypothetical protein
MNLDPRVLLVQCGCRSNENIAKSRIGIGHEKNRIVATLDRERTGLLCWLECKVKTKQSNERGHPYTSSHPKHDFNYDSAHSQVTNIEIAGNVIKTNIHSEFFFFLGSKEANNLPAAPLEADTIPTFQGSLGCWSAKFYIGL